MARNSSNDKGRRFSRALSDVRNSGIDNIWCSAFLDDGSACLNELKKNNHEHATQDSQGFWWCNDHKNRGWLLDYAKAHNFPLVQFGTEEFPRIAVGGNTNDPELWTMFVPVTKDATIEAAIVAIRAMYESNDGDLDNDL